MNALEHLFDLTLPALRCECGQQATLTSHTCISSRHLSFEGMSLLRYVTPRCVTQGQKAEADRVEVAARNLDIRQLNQGTLLQCISVMTRRMTRRTTKRQNLTEMRLQQAILTSDSC